MTGIHHDFWSGAALPLPLTTLDVHCKHPYAKARRACDGRIALLDTEEVEETYLVRN